MSFRVAYFLGLREIKIFLFQKSFHEFDVVGGGEHLRSTKLPDRADVLNLIFPLRIAIFVGGAPFLVAPQNLTIPPRLFGVTEEVVGGKGLMNIMFIFFSNQF